jgi:hypothetical protein
MKEVEAVAGMDDTMLITADIEGDLCHRPAPGKNNGSFISHPSELGELLQVENVPSLLGHY